MNTLLLAAGGFFMFTVMDLSIKWLLQSYSLVQVTFFNCLFAMIGLLVWVYPKLDVLKTTRPKMHFYHAILVLISDLLAIYSYGEIEIAQAYTLILTMPLFTVIFALIIGYEAFSIARIGISVVGFVGALLVLAPGYSAFNIAMLSALGCAITEAVGVLMIAHHKNQETPQAFAFYGLSLLTMITGVATLFDFTPMALADIGISIIGGIGYALASAMVIIALQRGKLSAVSSIQYSQLLWGLLLGYIIWGEKPDALAILGGIIVVCAGLCLIRLKHD